MVSTKDWKASGPMAILTCPSSGEIQCAAGQAEISCQAPPSNPSATELNIGNFSCSVSPGESVSIDNTHKVARQTNVEQESKIWQLPLLAIDAGPDSELLTILRPVLASLGMSKMRHMNEQHIRELGPLGAIPLLVYAQTEQSPEQIELRRRAVWLAGEIGDARCLPWLKQLADDVDPQVNQYARASVDRLSQ